MARLAAQTEPILSDRTWDAFGAIFWGLLPFVLLYFAVTWAWRAKRDAAEAKEELARMRADRAAAKNRENAT